MNKLKNIYQKGVTRAMSTGASIKEKIADFAAKAEHNLTSEDAGLSDAVVTVIILLGGVIVAIIVYNVARRLVTNTSNGVDGAANNLIANLTDAAGNTITN